MTSAVGTFEGRRLHAAVLGGLLLVACSPDLSAHEAIRCDDDLTCGPEAACYRGFCVPDSPTVYDPIVGDEDGGYFGNPDHPPFLLDGGAFDVGNSPDADVPGPPDAGPPDANLPDAQLPTIPDASVPDASTSCTQRQCCDEARHWFRQDKPKDEGKGKGKSCGCDNLLQAIACGLFPAAPAQAPSMQAGLP